MENCEIEECDLEIIEDTDSFIEKKKPHARKGQPPTQIQLDNLAKGRDLRKKNAIVRIEEEAKKVILKRPELVRAVAMSAPPQDDTPTKPKKKKPIKQVIVLEDESSESEEEQQIIIRRKKHKSKIEKEPKIQYESESESDDDPPPQPKPKIIFRKW
jgi:hypothetical protein